MNDARPADADGWARLSPHVKAYERAKAAVTCGDHVVRTGDLAALERELDLRPG